MACSINEIAAQSIGRGNYSWETSTIKLALLSLATIDTGIRTITAASNATPIVLTTGLSPLAWTVGDLVTVENVGGNLGANGIWRVGATSTTTNLSLVDPVTGANSVGTGSYTSGGTVVNLSNGGSVLGFFDAGVVSTAVTLSGKTSAAQGILDATDPTFPTVAGVAVSALLLYQDTGSPSTSRVIAYYDGFQDIVAAATAATSATTIWVKPLLGPLASGVTLTFSNGQAATTTASAAAGDQSITVSALSGGVTVGNRASGPITGVGLPFTPDGSNVSITVSLNYFMRLMDLR